MSSSISNPLSAAPTPSSAASSSAALDSLANPNVFLQLLISQLEHQDPENPADGTAFVTQLATFSQVGQSSEMVSDLDAIKAALAGLTASASTGIAAGTPATGTASATATTPSANPATVTNQLLTHSLPNS
jgi:flagellar basal-body rod modification protein FlgD